MKVTVDNAKAQEIDAFIQKASKAGYSEDEIKQAIERRYSAPKEAVSQPETESQDAGSGNMLARGVQTILKNVSDVREGVGNVVAGGVRGAADIGTTLMYPIDKAMDVIKGNRFEQNVQRRRSLDPGLEAMGADPDSLAYQGGKISGQIAGTAGAGGVLGNMVRGLSQSPRALAFANALRTGGFSTGSPAAATAAGNVADMGVRTAGGAATGATMAGLVNPEDAGTGAVLGAALPVGLRAADMVGEKALKPLARSLMQSAIKPTIKQLRTGDAKVAVDTLLKYGINPTEKGVGQLRGHVDDLNQLIADKLKGSTATVNRGDVLNYLDDVRTKFGTQVNPLDDLNAIQRASDEFRTQFPSALHVETAQKLKQGTYKTLAGKYGEVGSASTEAQKALARGLKDNIADVVPGIGELNAEEARLLKTLGVTERRALMELNKNPVGLSALASNPVGFAAFMADRSAAFKALAARAANRSADLPGKAGAILANPALRAGVMATQTD